MQGMRTRTGEIERRGLLATQLSARAAEEGASGPGSLDGYAAVWNEETEIGWFREEMVKGAFAASIQEDDQRALIDHDTGKVIGRRSAGTLRLKEDDKGLQVEMDLPDTSYARDLFASVARGDTDGMSIGFNVLEEEHIRPGTHGDEEREKDLWRITKAQLMEVSVVTFPAYEGTSVSTRCRTRREEARDKPSVERAESKRKLRERRLRVLRLKQGGQSQ